jgi:type I site-specific restriction endonuclease
MNEAETRAEYIDPKLKASGWGEMERSKILRELQDNEKTIPTILTTSQKLSTGVDARNIYNIVLMRPINSMIEFKQIIGRGTIIKSIEDKT